MLALPLRRFTVEEYHRLAEVGVLAEDDHVELVDGNLIQQMPIGPHHGSIVSRLNEHFAAANRARWITKVQDPVDLGLFSEPEPDVMLVRRVGDHYAFHHPQAGDAYLVIEVSDSTLLVDKEEKLPVYARAELPEVWIVNLPERVIECYAAPVGGVFTETRRIRPGEPLAPAAFPDAMIDTAALFRGPI